MARPAKMLARPAKKLANKKWRKEFHAKMENLIFQKSLILS